MHSFGTAGGAALVVFVAASLFYALTLCPTVYVAGTGENATAAAILGVPHPPGFPLFCLLGRLAVVALPVSPARAVNILAAASGAGAAAIVAWMVARLGGAGWVGGLAGCAAGLLLASARTFWSQAVIAEVYSLSALLLAVELALVLAWRGDLGVLASLSERKEKGKEKRDQDRQPRERWLLAFSLAFGVGVSLHPLHALMLPGFALLLLTSPERPRLPTLAAAVALLVLGLSLHFYTPLRSARDPFLDWGDPESWQAVGDYLTAAQYRERMFSLSAAEVGENVHRLGKLLLGQWSPLLLLVPAAGAVALAARRPALAAGLGLMAAADLVYAVNYDIPWEIEVYYIPLILTLAVAAGVAVAMAARTWRPLGALAAAVAGFLPVALNFAGADHRHEDLVDRYGRDILDVLPAGAVLITPPVNPTFVLLYLTAVERVRPDVRVFVAGESGLVPLGDALRPGERPAVTPWILANDALHPVFYAERDPLDDLPGFRLEPIGPVYRLVRSGVPASSLGAPPRLRVDPARDVDRGDDFHLRLIGVRYRIASSDHAWAMADSIRARAEIDRARELGGDLAAVEAAIALSLAAAGQRGEAIAAYERALAIEEDPALHNRVGRLELEAGHAARAEAAFRRAIALDDRLAMAHSNLGALLGQRGDYAGAVAELERAVALDPNSIKAHNNLGTALLITGQGQRSATFLRRSLALNPDQPGIAALLRRAEATSPSM